MVLVRVLVSVVEERVTTLLDTVVTGQYVVVVVMVFVVYDTALIV